MTDIDATDLEACLAVLARVEQLPPEHPQAVAVRRATAKLFKTVKEQRRAERRAAVIAADNAVFAATATAAPGRIDDETRGIELTTAAGATAGTLIRARPCYQCKRKYTEVDGFYHQLCPECATLNRERREARADLTGRRALLTGGRAKIGMYIALRLLRDGAHTTITTRFPKDAARRFASMPDSHAWIDRLKIVGIDLRQPGQVMALADAVAAEGPLDIIINNAAQTVRRSPDAYALLVAGEAEALPAAPDVLELGDAHDLHPVTTLALTARSTAVDAGGLVPDDVDHNSWTQRVGEVDPVEMLEVQLCNATAPFILIDRLRASLAASPARRTYIVNVSAMEGSFGRGYKGPGHPHTNMAKAALNMLTRTSARELLETDGILMTSVDTGWITDERPQTTKLRLADEGFHAPLDLVDGASRVYDPIVRGEAGEDLHGVFLKDYAPTQW
ncbi:SDR family NAD(P)-dependent oxidoreductase [Solirubrobacter phytolaccae]|uniref:SDR family NAD(P)-dependent oxidoreductase n=1 Tax=Solirubrobacter phytolaccae TaxID=1404360 RepID=A0A9X3NH29_9ACTN|nr:SDR family NAD(P)-dependent oxidoreductase [Solirubrobacter phytolaccae]MDA0185259.1 SDR family NAD(P)-dependent oxidoreductase [Solirubrobacter phytolaccae]